MKDFWDKMNWVAVLTVADAILMQLGNGSMSLAHQLPAAWLPGIQEATGNIASILSLIATVGAFGRVPSASAPSSITPTITKILLAAFALSFLLGSGSANAQASRRSAPAPFDLGTKIKQDIDGANQKIAEAVTPPADPKAALPCMDITVLFKLTPANLVPTMKACVQDANNRIVTDTQRALDSAKTYTKTGETAAIGDSDGINCLTPALALFQAAAIVPATPDVMNADGSIKIKGTPEIEPGLILLFQKYREFTISGGLTSCQAWVNGPVNATAAAGIAGAGAAAGAAALLAPK